MDAELIYSLVGVAIFALFAYFALKDDTSTKIQTKEEKRYEIIGEYSKTLRLELEPLKNDKQAYLAKKSSLLKSFSDELALNIFFDAVEIKEIIQDLATQN